MSRDPEPIPLAMWLGFFAAAVLTHAVMLAPSSAALSRALREPVPQRGGGERWAEFEMVEDPNGPRAEDPDHARLVELHRANRKTPDADARVAEVDSDAERETKARNQPDARGRPTPPGNQRPPGADDGAQTPTPTAVADPAETGRPDAARATAGEVQVIAAPDGHQPTAPGGATVEPNPRAATASLGGSPGVLHQSFGTPGTHDRLEDVEEADENLLDSRNHRYASFFNRVRDEVVKHWRPEQVHDAHDPDRTIYGLARRETVLLVHLDEAGAIAEVVVETGSGALHLDEEAVRAMRAAAPFANPPSERAADGHFEFRFAFGLPFDGEARVFVYKK